MSDQTSRDICCPEFNPKPWDDQFIEWNEKRFLKDRVLTIFYMPLSFGKTMTRLISKVEAAGAEMPDGVCLSDHTSKWNMDLYLAVDREIPGGDNVTISGKFYSKVYEGPFRDTGKWMADLQELAKSRGHQTGKIYLWYTTCPKCALKYGKNYVVIFSTIE